MHSCATRKRTSDSLAARCSTPCSKCCAQPWTNSSPCVRVSIRLRGEEGFRRIASIAAGATVGEMAMLEGGRRTATVTADADVCAYELRRDAFEATLRAHPLLGQKLLGYFAREMTRRLRLLHRDLRSAG